MLKFKGFQNSKVNIYVSEFTDKNMSPNHSSCAAENKNLLYKNLNLELPNIYLNNNSHSNNLTYKSGKNFKLYCNKPLALIKSEQFFTGSDGIITNDKDLTLGTLTADCIPLYIYDLDLKFFGVIHIGVIAAVNNIVKNIKKFCIDNNFDINNTVCEFGAHIHYPNFDVSKSFLWKENIKPFILNKFDSYIDKHNKFKFKQLVSDQLIEIGINKKNINCLELDTYKDERFFSHSRFKNGDGENGRIINLINIIN